MKKYISNQVLEYYRCMIKLNTPEREAFKLAVEFKNQLKKKYGIG